MTPRPGALDVLVVCTANRCRSPMIEALLRRAGQERELDWSISSAGTHAGEGQPMHPSAARALARRRIDTRPFASRRLDQSCLDTADLILTAAEEHREHIGRLRPAALQRTFTLLQFAHLARAAGSPEPSVAPGDARALIDAVHLARGRVQPLPPQECDLADPVGRSRFHFTRCAATIDRAVAAIMSPLNPG